MLKSPTQLKVDCIPLTLPPDRAMSFALITNELLTNAVKYGGGADARIALVLSATPSIASLVITNDVPDVPAPTDSGGGFGTMMIRAMVLELSGDMASDEQDKAYRVEVTFPLATGHTG